MSGSKYNDPDYGREYVDEDSEGARMSISEIYEELDRIEAEDEAEAINEGYEKVKDKGLITLTTENGELNFLLLKEADHGFSHYALLEELNKYYKGTKNVYIFKVKKRRNGEEEFEAVNNDRLLNKLAKIFEIN